jgi:predicted DCC family thiol-disulfide oxidoreductase YuxK|tara:strand:+ start:36 stop:443 length:408 start_codon:yes stop_codon:yes gene_type:complete
MIEKNEFVVYYDGICGLCDFFVNLIVKIDSKGILKFSSLQGPSGQKLLNDLKFNTEELDTVIFRINDQVYTKSTAVFKIIKSIGGFWRVFLVFDLLPTSFSDFIYKKIAKNRYKLFGKLEQCDISKFNKPGQFID